MALESSPDRPQVDRPKDKQRSRVANGSALLAGVDGRSVWIRRCKELLADHLSEIPDPTAAERSLIRRAAVLTTELERLEVKFALADGADPETLDLYGRTSGNLRRLLEAVGLQRRAKDISPSLADIMREEAAE